MAGGPTGGAEFTGPLSGKTGLIAIVLGRKRQRSSSSTPPENSSQAWNLADNPPAKDRIRILAASIATCLIHLGIVFLTPEDGFIKPSEERTPVNPTYEVALVPPEPEEQQFVQTNPDVPQNEPDETRNFANRSQQAAQEDPDPDSEDSMPTVEGEIEESNQILEGNLEDPTPPAPPPSPQQNTPPSPPQPEANPSEENPSTPDNEAARPEIRGVPQERPTPPAPEFLKQEAESKEGPGSTSGPEGDTREIPEETPERVIPITAPVPVLQDPQEGVIQLPSNAELTEAVNPRPQRPSPDSAETPQMPRPRPRLNPNVVPAPLMESNQRASRTGRVAVDAQFSEYGDYLQRMVEAVSRAWNASVSRVELIKERPSRVKVRFTIDSRGNIRNMRVVDKTPNAQLLATGLCMDAIQSRAPYDRWTQDMVQTLGTEQEITFTFHYR